MSPLDDAVKQVVRSEQVMQAAIVTGVTVMVATYVWYARKIFKLATKVS